MNLLHSLLVDTLVDNNSVTGIRIHNKSGSQQLSAKTAIDATGDADVAVGAGAAFMQDLPEASLNATLLFRVAGVDTDLLICDATRIAAKVRAAG